MKISMPPVAGDGPNVLILGSMPGEVSLNHQEYYAHPRNHFWPIISAYLEIPVQDLSYHEKKEVLKSSKLALWDVVKECRRSGSLDSGIKDAVPNDILSMLETYPTITSIGLNGRKAYQLFNKLIKVPDHIYITYLPSTSPVPGKNVKTYKEKEAIWKEFLNTHNK
jgi:hypoxanthine-DNA glycosylase